MIAGLRSVWIRLTLNVTLVGAFLIIAGGAQAGIPPSDADVRKILADRVDALVYFPAQN